jgi:hypothetical protein
VGGRERKHKNKEKSENKEIDVSFIYFICSSFRSPPRFLMERKAKEGWRDF